jgi:hypothetical protein
MHARLVRDSVLNCKYSGIVFLTVNIQNPVVSLKIFRTDKDDSNTNLQFCFILVYWKLRFQLNRQRSRCSNAVTY